MAYLYWIIIIIITITFAPLRAKEDPTHLELNYIYI